MLNIDLQNPCAPPGSSGCVPLHPLCSGRLMARGNWVTSWNGLFQKAHKRAEDDVALSSIIRWSWASSRGRDDSAYYILKHSLAFLAVKVMRKEWYFKHHDEGDVPHLQRLQRGCMNRETWDVRKCGGGGGGAAVFGLITVSIHFCLIGKQELHKIKIRSFQCQKVWAVL